VVSHSANYAGSWNEFDARDMAEVSFGCHNIRSLKHEKKLQVKKIAVVTIKVASVLVQKTLLKSGIGSQQAADMRPALSSTSDEDHDISLYSGFNVYILFFFLYVAAVFETLP